MTLKAQLAGSHSPSFGSCSSSLSMAAVKVALAASKSPDAFGLWYRLFQIIHEITPRV